MTISTFTDRLPVGRHVHDTAFQRPLMVAPYDPAIISTSVALTVNLIYACRVIVPKKGTLRDLATVHGGTAAGNHRLGIYDTGDALAGSRTLLWDSGSVAVTVATPPWQIAGDPALAVTEGQHLDFVLMVDTATTTFGRVSSALSGQGYLPANYCVAPGGALPKLTWNNSPGSYGAFPATIAEANCGVSSGVISPCIIGRVV